MLLSAANISSQVHVSSSDFIHIFVCVEILILCEAFSVNPSLMILVVEIRMGDWWKIIKIDMHEVELTFKLSER